MSEYIQILLAGEFKLSLIEKYDMLYTNDLKHSSSLQKLKV
jgi:hypothetical protein